MSKKQMQELENGKISPRVYSAPKKAVADAMEPVAKKTAQFWAWNSMCLFFLYEPKLPKKLQNIE